MTINNEYTTEIELIELKILIFENEYKKVKSDNIILANYFEELISFNKIYINHITYNSYELEINKLYDLIEIAQDEDIKLCKEFNVISYQIYRNKNNFNLCEKLTEDLEENIKKSEHNQDKIKDYKNIINKLKKEREEVMLKWKQ